MQHFAISNAITLFWGFNHPQCPCTVVKSCLKIVKITVIQINLASVLPLRLELSNSTCRRDELISPEIQITINFQLINNRKTEIKFSSYSWYYTEVSKDCRGPSPQLRTWATQHSTSQPWRAVGASVSDFSGPVIEPMSSRVDSAVLNPGLRQLRVK